MPNFQMGYFHSKFTLGLMLAVLCAGICLPFIYFNYSLNNQASTVEIPLVVLFFMLSFLISITLIFKIINQTIILSVEEDGLRITSDSTFSKKILDQKSWKEIDKISRIISSNRIEYCISHKNSSKKIFLKVVANTNLYDLENAIKKYFRLEQIIKN